MADITEHDPQQSPSAQDDALATGNGASATENRGLKRSRVSAAADDDDDDDDKPGRERRKIEIKFIQDKSRRHITFSKRKAGIMKKVSRHQAFNPRSIRQATRVTASAQPAVFPDFHMLNRKSTCRHTNCPYSPARKCYCWSCPRLASSIRSRHRNFNRSSPKLKAKI
jgi:hypothetical protein